MSSGELTLCSVCKTYMWPHCICLCPNVNPEKNENNHLANEEYKKWLILNANQQLIHM